MPIKEVSSPEAFCRLRALESLGLERGGAKAAWEVHLESTSRFADESRSPRHRAVAR